MGTQTGASLKIIYKASYKRNFRKYDQKAVLEIMRLAKTHCVLVLNVWWWVGQKILNGAGKYSHTPVSR